MEEIKKTVLVEQITYKTSDGKEFTNKPDAQNHELGIVYRRIKTSYLGDFGTLYLIRNGDDIDAMSWRGTYCDVDSHIDYPYVILVDDDEAKLIITSRDIENLSELIKS